MLNVELLISFVRSPPTCGSRYSLYLFFRSSSKKDAAAIANAINL